MIFFQRKWIAIANSQLQFHTDHKGVIWINSLWFTTILRWIQTSSTPCCHTPSYPLGLQLFTESKNRRKIQWGSLCHEAKMEGQISSVQRESGPLYWHSAGGCCALCWRPHTLRTEADKNTDSTWGSCRQKQTLTEMAWSGLRAFLTPLANPFKLCPMHRLQDSRAWSRTGNKHG